MEIDLADLSCYSLSCRSVDGDLTHDSNDLRSTPDLFIASFAAPKVRGRSQDHASTNFLMLPIKRSSWRIVIDLVRSMHDHLLYRQMSLKSIVW